MGDTGILLPRDRSAHPAYRTPEYKTTLFRAPRNTLLTLDATDTENTGPVFGHDQLGELDNNLILNFTKGKAAAQGVRIRLHGRIMDENGRAVPNALVEIWHANAGGRYRHVNDTHFAPLDPNFGGCGRTISDENGAYEFLTILPGAYPWPNRGNDWRPKHIHFSIFGHAFGQRLVTQMYFEGDPLIPLCPIANTVEDRGQLESLVAALDMRAGKPMNFLAYKFDIVLRGRRQTMFENMPEGM